MDEEAHSPAVEAAIAQQLVDAFLRYNEDFRELTRRAARCFEERDWQQGRSNAVARIELYDQAVNRALGELGSTVEASESGKAFWIAVKERYAELIREYPDNAFFKTFFSSISRRLFNTVGVDPRVEFIAADVLLDEKPLDEKDVRTYHNRGALQFVIDQVLSDFNFGVPYRDRERTIRFVTAEIEAYCKEDHNQQDLEIVELMVPVFYRATRVDLEHVGATVGFLQRLMPRKRMDEIYTVLGRAKQGKTERYRLFFEHLRISHDLFVRAQGVKGMVMEVFTLPSYDVVFKVIRDRFDYPKTGSRADVMEKYKLVFMRDRAGRLVDAQEFRQLRFPRERFDPELLTDLLEECGSICRVEDGDVVVEHAYIERRMVPLNLYLETATDEQAAAAAIEYGQAIKDLALSNIFAGDLLLKNFGVSRHGRVIFYDYDELCLVTDCNFRRMPEPRDDIDEMRAGAWFYVGPHDIFPEQFIEFLGFKAHAKQAFLEHHGDLLTPEYWTNLKHRHEAGEIFEVLPYVVDHRTEHRGHTIVPITRS
jgi:isocitrate dehydrogenase kinase/phosphatase